MNLTLLVMFIFLTAITNSFSNISDDQSLAPSLNALSIEKLAEKIDPYGYLCRSNCPNGYKDIFLLANARSFYDKGFKNTIFLMEDDYRLLSEDFGGKKKIIFDSAESLKNGILFLNDQCFRVKKLLVGSHGSSGAVHTSVDHEFITLRNIEIFNGISCAFSENSEIVLNGCKIASGIEGEDFIAEMGIRMLYLRGGTIKATTALTSTLPLPFGIYAPRFPINGVWKKFTFHDGRMEDNQYSLPLEDRINLVDEKLKILKQIIDRTEKKNTREFAETGYGHLLNAKMLLKEARDIGGLNTLDKKKRLTLSKSMAAGLVWFEEAFEMDLKEITDETLDLPFAK